MSDDRSSSRRYVSAAVLALVLVAAGAYVTGRMLGNDTETQRPSSNQRPGPGSEFLVAPGLGSPSAAVTGVLAATDGGEEKLAAPPDRSPSGDRPSATPTPDPSHWADPIYSSEDALSRAMALLPAGTQVVSATARLLDYNTVAAWEGDQFRATHYNAPVWLVGVLAPDVTYGDLMPMLPGMDAFGMDEEVAALAAEPLSAEGLYFVFDANSGDMRTMSTFAEVRGRDYDSLRALRDIATTIEPATPMPPVPTTDPAELLPDY